MPKLREILIILLLLAGVLAALSVAALALELRREAEVRASVTAQLGQEVTLLRREAVAEVQALRLAAEAQLVATRRDVQQELDATRRAAQTELVATRASLEQHLSVMWADVRPVLHTATHTMQTYQALPDRVAYANRWLWDCSEYSGCLQSQTLALVGSARHTMGQIARVAPKMAESLDRAAQAAAITAEGSAATAQNVAALTKPVNPWLRRVGIIASIGAPVAQIATPFILPKINTRTVTIPVTEGKK